MSEGYRGVGHGFIVCDLCIYLKYILKGSTRHTPFTNVWRSTLANQAFLFLIVILFYKSSMAIEIPSLR